MLLDIPPLDIGVLINALSGTPLHILVLVGIIVLWKENRDNSHAEIDRLNTRVEELEQLLAECIKEQKS